MPSLKKIDRSHSVTRLVESGDALALLDFCVEKSFIHREDWLSSPEELRKELEQETDVARLLNRLVETKLLTNYQAGRIEAGTVHGMNLGSYRILERIGIGGMGVVFRAEHIHLRRMAAIKMLPLYASAHSEGPLLTRFFNEIRIIAQLQHPNIVGAIDTGEIPGEGPDAPALYYHVMEYVPGKDLENLVQSDGPLSVMRACDLTYQIASALVEAEKHNLVHPRHQALQSSSSRRKALTPSCSISALARRMHNRHTQQGMVLGTIDYLAARSEAQDASCGGHSRRTSTAWGARCSGRSRAAFRFPRARRFSSRSSAASR